jgi:predicted dienelactone hydrolase
VPLALGTLGSYQVATLEMTFTEPAHTGASGDPLPVRRLLTEIRYPTAFRPAVQSGSVGGTTPGPVHGRFPLLLFAPGFQQCGTPYADLLRTWASAGYVVVTVDFPHSNCKVGTAATQADKINQPGDMSYVLTRVLALSRRSAGFFAGRLDATQVGVAGQSDGGDTVAALAANSCCADTRPKAVAVLSGAEWPPMPGRYFTRATPPMLFVQGSADTVNPPWQSRQLYAGTATGPRYYLDLLGADHTTPYWGTNRYEQVVARVTVAFFDRYVLGHSGALTAMARAAGTPGIADLVSGDQPAP